jgi:dTDP-4-dehydrorhamnose 3,5-epimerase
MNDAPDSVEVRRTVPGGPLLMLPRRHPDGRGFFQETYRRTTLSDLGIDCDWVQANHSRSERGVLRGLHFQVGEGQAKLVRCARGAIRDVTVDIRHGSPSYGEWQAYDIDDVTGGVVYVPVGFAHGFCVTSEIADVIYDCSAYYDPALERRIAYDDPALGIQWPEIEHILSDADAAAPTLAESAEEIPFSYAESGTRG